MSSTAGVGVEPCLCSNPSVQKLFDGKGKEIAKQCLRCMRLYLQPCPQCSAWVKDVLEHVKDFHPRPRKPSVRKKREVLTPVEQYALERSHK